MDINAKPLSLLVIMAAIDGDEASLTAIVNHYRCYINALAARPIKDEYGNE